MNSSMMELDLNEMAMVTGGDTIDHVAGAVTGVTAGAMVGCMVGSIAGAPGAVIGLCVGAVGCGTAGGYFGLTKIKNWIRSL